MRITERQLRRIVSEVIAEELIKEGIKDKTIMKTAAAVLAVVGMYNVITGGPADILKAQEAVNNNPGIERVIDHEALTGLRHYTPGVDTATIYSNY